MLSVLMLKLIQYKRDIAIVLLMAALTVVFIFVLSGPNNGTYKYEILVATDEKTPSYERYIRELSKNKSYEFIEANYDDVKADVEEGKILAGIYFKDDNISILKTKEDINIFVLENIASSTLFNIQSISKMAKEITNYIDELKPVDKEKVEAFAYKDISDSINNRKYMEVNKSYLDTDNTMEYDGFKHITIGMTLFMSMYTIVFGIGSILEDKQYHIWEKMLISPLSKRDILGGNLIATFIVGSGQILLLIVLTKYMMGMDWGSGRDFIWIISIGLLFVLATTSLGLMLSGLVKTQRQLSTITPIILTSTSMLGGAMWPLDIVESKILLFLANLTPQKWAIEGMEKIAMYGGGFNDVLSSIIVLIIMTIIFFTIGVLTLKNNTN
ncbi:ABC transporter permease [Tissierella sp. Yu-01]|uniref:ABC transporter permease n=1 Tax=Tissierella sp. Yu-01 TaxID=3035694 RepID=UPI00240D83D5|nr:ABC transporter permease [Tissierella sp. Yu-01]WFA08757.1 ABC transporter permease [Tissierella sp. Yu-01]